MKNETNSRPREIKTTPTFGHPTGGGEFEIPHIFPEILESHKNTSLNSMMSRQKIIKNL